MADIQNYIHRLLIMVDISLLHFGFNLSAIQESAQKLLDSCDTDKTLFTFKFFDSTLSPYRSKTLVEKTLGRDLSRASFDSVSDNQIVFKKCLKMISKASDPQKRISPKIRAENIAKSLQEIVFDHAWDHSISDTDSSSSNLVALFCSLPHFHEKNLSSFDFGKDLENTKNSENIKKYHDNHKDLESDKKNLGNNKKYLDHKKDFDHNKKKIDDTKCKKSTVDDLNENFDHSLGFADDLEVTTPLGFTESEMLVGFRKGFRNVSESFKSRDIRLCWIDFDRRDGGASEIFKEEVRKLDFGYLTVDVLVCGSRLVPFELIWQSIAFPDRGLVKLKCGIADLVLDLDGIDGNPLFCKVCELQLSVLEACKAGEIQMETCSVPGMELHMVLQRISSRKFRKVHLTEIFHRDKCLDLRGLVSCSFMVSCVRKGGKKERKGSGEEGKSDLDFIGDEFFKKCGGEFRRGRPIWQLLLVFLARKECFASATVYDEENISFSAVLQPLTVHTGVLRVIENGVSFPKVLDLVGEAKIHDQNEDKIHVQKENNGNLDSLDSENRGVEQKPLKQQNGAGRGSAKKSPPFDYSSWESFFVSVVKSLNKRGCNSNASLSLERRYFKSLSDKSKLLRFFERWLKKKTKRLERSSGFVMKQNLFSSQESQADKTGLKVSSSLLEGTECRDSADIALVPSSPLPDEVAVSSPLPSSLADLPSLETLDSKIQCGLLSEEVDLQALAKCVVNILCQHAEAEQQCQHASSELDNSESGNFDKGPDYLTMIQTILKKPKELFEKYKECLPPSTGEHISNLTDRATHSSEDKVREYELQILFRLEILDSKLSEGIGEKIKNAFIKDICKLLDSIQFNLPGGIFGGESLVDFADRAIYSRYNGNLKEVIDEVYRIMEFNPLEESDDVTPLTSNEEREAEAYGGEYIASAVKNKLLNDSSRDESSSGQLGSMEPVDSGEHRLRRGNIFSLWNEDYQRKLKQAKEKRDRAWRFAHFTSRASDLQRVWAPKHPNQYHKKCRRKSAAPKKNKKRDEDFVVFETPAAHSKSAKHSEEKTMVIPRSRKRKIVDVVEETPFLPSEKRFNFVESECDVVFQTPYDAPDVQVQVTGTGTIDSGPDLEAVPTHTSLVKDKKIGSVSRSLFDKM